MKNKRVLLVEDSEFSRIGIRDMLRKAGWEVVWAEGRESAHYRIAQVEKEKKTFDIFAIDLGLPPLWDKPDEGLELATELRKKYISMPILVYTNQGPKSFDYDLVLRKLLSLRVSFVFLRPGDDRISLDKIIDFLMDGFLVLSHTPARYLPTTIASTPDPLEDKYWQTLKLLSEDKTYQEVAEEIGVVRATITKWMPDIKDILVEKLKEHPSFRSDDEMNMDSETIEIADLVSWYRENHIRYCRD